MTRLATFVFILTAGMWGTAAEASAQNPILPSMKVPRAEIGIFGGLWNLDSTGDVGIGGRLTINRSDWFGIEGSFDIKKPSRDAPGTDTLTILNARLQAFDSREGAILFATGGFAFGTGLDRTFSPIIGVGAGRWIEDPNRRGIGSLRVEVQRFLGGAMHDGRRHARLVLSATLGIP